MQNVIAEDRPEVGLSVVVLKTADRKSKILRVLAPLGVLLPNGLGLNVDGKDIGRAYFVRCFADGCYAEVVLEDELLKTFRSGESATFIVFQTPEEGIGIPVDLKGFARRLRRAALIEGLLQQLCGPTSAWKRSCFEAENTIMNTDLLTLFDADEAAMRKLVAEALVRRR